MAYVPQDLLDRITALEREVRELRGRAQIRPAMNQILHGDTVIGEGGRLLVQDPDGDAIFETGQSPAGDWSVTMRRDTGAPAIGVGANTYPGDSAVNQMVRIFNRAGDVIVMDDYYADGYLGRPYVPVPVTPGVDVTSSTERTTHIGILHVQHRVVHATTSVYAPAGTTISMRYQLQLSGGVLAYEQIGNTFTVVGGAAGQELTNTQRIPIDRAHSERCRLMVRATRTAGSGTGTVFPFGLWGVNTATPEEA
ncbi:hypothetical protein OG909_12280 [Streptomyces sp. NBC_01754]|uniref:hypothetical protein n=1 Tax=Streptomyces sp. NBC_01754 TaxID=2975930 RepID=UPI002DDAE9E7|nr:hypothetical protein [Streptomyces sp. NBC_01754]WSC93012.1 hypothetical protein OG909_12280 [Streptomyces sp. NBC_01754]